MFSGSGQSITSCRNRGCTVPSAQFSVTPLLLNHTCRAPKGIASNRKLILGDLIIDLLEKKKHLRDHMTPASGLAMSSTWFHAFHKASPFCFKSPLKCHLFRTHLEMLLKCTAFHPISSNSCLCIFIIYTHAYTLHICVSVPSTRIRVSSREKGISSCCAHRVKQQALRKEEINVYTRFLLKVLSDFRYWRSR